MTFDLNWNPSLCLLFLLDFAVGLGPIVVHLAVGWRLKDSAHESI